MHAEDYVKHATMYISDPGQALEVARELQAHLTEITAEVTAQGVDPETAEQVAIARMGPPENLALSLAEAHHKHLPWRHYFAVIPLFAMLVVYEHWNAYWAWNIGKWWLALVILCLIPSKSVLQKFWCHITIDVRMKWHWLTHQQWQAPVRSGGAAGAAAGLAWSVTPPLSRGEPLLPILITFLIGALVTLAARRFFRGDYMLTAWCASLAFAIAFLPGILLWWGYRPDWAIAWLLFSGIFLLIALTVGWLAHRLTQRQRATN